MAQYADSAVIERNWFLWLLAKGTPSLDLFREAGLLWTKASIRKDNRKPDANEPSREHCLAFGTPIWFKSNFGQIEGGLDPAIYDACSLIADSPLYCFDKPLLQHDVVIPALKEAGFVREYPAMLSWHAMLTDIYKICNGVATKFNLPNDEDYQELANEAMAQLTIRLAERKLVYIPGFAPVFGFLTTCTYRVMYSILNRNTRRRTNTAKLADDVQHGVLRSPTRSLRVSVIR